MTSGSSHRIDEIPASAVAHRADGPAGDCRGEDAAIAHRNGGEVAALTADLPDVARVVAIRGIMERLSHEGLE